MINPSYSHVWTGRSNAAVVAAVVRAALTFVVWDGDANSQAMLSGDVGISIKCQVMMGMVVVVEVRGDRGARGFARGRGGGMEKVVFS